MVVPEVDKKLLEEHEGMEFSTARATKRTMDALEHRFALAKAEIQPQKRRRPTTTLLPMAPNTNHKAEEEPVYSPISQPLHKNLSSSSPLSPTGKAGVDKILHELLQSGDSAQKYLHGSKSKTQKIDNYILLDNFVPPSTKSGASLIRSKQSRKRMSMRKLKKAGCFEIPEDFKRFEACMAMHDMWRGYLVKLLRSVRKNQFAQCLMKADFHGAVFRVVACDVEGLAGVVGVVVRETKETFGIVTVEDEFRALVKRGSVFALQADCWRATLLGDKLVSRNLSS